MVKIMMVEKARKAYTKIYVYITKSYSILEGGEEKQTRRVSLLISVLGIRRTWLEWIVKTD